MSKPYRGQYTITWVEDDFGIDPADDNVDVVVRFEGGERFVATFFTLENLRSLMEQYNETGECMNGLYVWSSHMIVIARLTRENVERAVADLIESDEFDAAFEGPVTDEEPMM
ncbi:MAG TPA: hypothetical protein VF722_10570 [Gemmatimonadaceae bacterium]|jgi:hypothetical protein